MSEHRVWQRFLAEGLLIVVSILLAFWIDAWSAKRQEATRGREYLALLASDLRWSISNNETFSANAGGPERAVAQLVRAYYEPELPPRDSLATWFAHVTEWWVVQPRLGTAKMLVATGDLDLLPDDSLRARLPAYLTIMSEFEHFEDLGTENFLAASQELVAHVDVEGLRLDGMPSASRDSLASSDEMFPAPAGPLRSRPRVDLGRLVLDEDVHGILVRMRWAKGLMRDYRDLQRHTSEELLARVEADLLVR